MTVPLPVLGLEPRDQDTLTLLTMCLWGEARNQTEEGLIAVSWVIKNRVLDGRWGDTWADVILYPKQFSCFNANDPQSRKMLEPDKFGTPSIWNRCGAVAEGVYRGEIPSPVGASTHYHTVQRPKGAKMWPPRWSQGMEKVRVVGDHVFYRERR